MKARRISGKTSYSPRLNKKAASFHTTSPPPPAPFAQSVSQSQPIQHNETRKSPIPILLALGFDRGRASITCMPMPAVPLGAVTPAESGGWVGFWAGLDWKAKKQPTRFVVEAGRSPKSTRSLPKRKISHPSQTSIPRPLNNHVRLRAAAPIPRAHHTSESQKTLTMMMN